MTRSSDAASFLNSGRGGVFKPPVARESFFSGGASPAGGLGWLLGGELLASASRMVRRFVSVRVVCLVLAILSCSGGLGWLLGGELVASASMMLERFPGFVGWVLSCPSCLVLVE